MQAKLIYSDRRQNNHYVWEGKGGELTEKEHKGNFYGDKNTVNIDLEGDYTLYTEDLFALLNIVS